jgi:hypothetical protein
MLDVCEQQRSEAVIIRFVEGSGFTSKLIIAQEKTAMPFTPSHVEAVMPDGSYLGAHFDGGVQARKPGYDAGQFANELFLTLEATAAQDVRFSQFMEKHIGEPYDWPAILGFVIPEHFHAPNHAICSALVTLALRDCGWFQWPLAAPAHLVDPRDLLLMISARQQVPM